MANVYDSRDLRKEADRYSIVDTELARLLKLPSFLNQLFAFANFWESRRWTRRAWLMQEVNLARDVRMFCGSSEISWSRTVDTVALIRDLGWYVQVDNITSVAKGFAEMTSLSLLEKLNILPRLLEDESNPAMAALTRACFDPDAGAESPFTTLFLFVMLLRPDSCSDQRDKIFAAYGLANFAAAEDGIRWSADYSLSTEVIYRNLVERVILSQRFLYPLSLVEDRSTRRLHTMPSWVPDFSVALLQTPLANLQDALSVSGFATHGRHFQALAATQSRSQSREVIHDVLYCDGADLDIIRYVYPKTSRSRYLLGSPQVPDLFHFEMGLLAFSLQIEAGSADGSPLTRLGRLLTGNLTDGFGHHTLEEVIHAWILLGIFGLASTASVTDREAYVLWSEDIVRKLSSGNSSKSVPSLAVIRQLRRCREKHGYDDTFDHSALSPCECQETLLTWSNKTSRFSGAFGHVLTMRVPFITKQGYLGLGPRSTQVGDQVWFVCDSAVPFVMRPRTQDEHYTLIGECYMEGLMHGEVLEDKYGLKERIAPFGIA